MGGYFDDIKAAKRAAVGDATNGATNGAALTIVAPGEATGYAVAALKREAADVARTTEPGRNERLNVAAFRMGRHVGAGNIDAQTVIDTLTDAGRACGLPEAEIKSVLRDKDNSGLTQGTQHPRHPAPREPIPEATVLAEASALAEGSTEDIGPPLNPIIDWHELYANDTDGEEWIVEPLLPARRMIAVYSAPKAGKSLLLLEIAVAVARGTEVIGTTPDPRRVLYVDFENDPTGDILTRLEAMELTPDQLDNLCYLTFPSLAKFDTPQGALDLLRHIEHYNCEVVIIDTVSRAVTGEENDNDTWLAFYRHTGLALKRAGVACIRLDHSGKDTGKGMRGGSAKYGDVDAVWRLTVLNEDSINLECTDNRMPVPMKNIILTRQEYPLAHRVVGDWQLVADANTRECDERLDALGVPSSASVREAGKALREGGHKVTNAALRAAVRIRKMRLDVPS